MQRIEILRDLRLGEFDVLVGINLLREGLDLPEVSLVAILDADKEGFLRSETSLIQTIGRAARNVDGTVLMYADEHHRLHEAGHLRDPAPPPDPARLQRGARDRPDHVRRKVSDILLSLRGGDEPAATQPKKERRRKRRDHAVMAREEMERLVKALEDEMHDAARDLRFEYAARLRDEVKDLRKELRAMREAGVGAG